MSSQEPTLPSNTPKPVRFVHLRHDRHVPYRADHEKIVKKLFSVFFGVPPKMLKKLSNKCSQNGPRQAPTIFRRFFDYFSTIFSMKYKSQKGPSHGPGIPKGSITGYREPNVQSVLLITEF